MSQSSLNSFISRFIYFMKQSPLTNCIFVMESAMRMMTIQVELDSRRLGGSALLIPFADSMLASTTCRELLQVV